MTATSAERRVRGEHFGLGRENGAELAKWAAAARREQAGQVAQRRSRKSTRSWSYPVSRRSQSVRRIALSTLFRPAPGICRVHAPRIRRVSAARSRTRRVVLRRRGAPGGVLNAAADHADGTRLPKFVEREFREFLSCGVLPRLRPSPVRRVRSRTARAVLLQRARLLPKLRRPAHDRVRRPPQRVSGS